MPVPLADWLAGVGVPYAESRSILVGTLLDSFQPYGATRCRSPVPQAAVPVKRESLSSLSGYPIFPSRETVDKSSSVKSESPPRLLKHLFPAQSDIS